MFPMRREIGSLMGWELICKLFPSIGPACSVLTRSWTWPTRWLVWASVGLRAFVALLQGNGPDDMLFSNSSSPEGPAWLLCPRGHRVAFASRAACGGISADPANRKRSAARLDDGGQARLLRSPIPRHEGRSHRRRAWTVRHSRTTAGFAARLLAKGHARSIDASRLSGYLGKGDVADRAFARFASAYADQTEADHKALEEAVKSGRLPARGRNLSDGRFRVILAVVAIRELQC